MVNLKQWWQQKWRTGFFFKYSGHTSFPESISSLQPPEAWAWEGILTTKQRISSATDVYWADALWTLHMVCINYDTMMWYLWELLIPNVIIHMSYTRKNSLIAISQCKILWWKTNNICTFLHRSHPKTFLQVRTIATFLITCLLVNFGCLQLLRTYLLKPWPNNIAMF